MVWENLRRKRGRERGEEGREPRINTTSRNKFAQQVRDFCVKVEKKIYCKNEFAVF